MFSTYCEPDVTSQDTVLFKKNLSSALLDLQITLEDQEIEEMFKKMDIDGSESLSLLEFESFVSQPSDLEKWAVSFPLHYLVADAVSCIEREGAHVLEKASNLTESDIQVVCEGILNGMKKMITAKVSELKKAYDAMHASQAVNEAGSKYFTVGKMSSGGPADFHKGLEGRIGFKSVL